MSSAESLVTDAMIEAYGASWLGSVDCWKTAPGSYKAEMRQNIRAALTAALSVSGLPALVEAATRCEPIMGALKMSGEDGYPALDQLRAALANVGSKS